MNSTAWVFAQASDVGERARPGLLIDAFGLGFSAVLVVLGLICAAILALLYSYWRRRRTQYLSHDEW